MPPIVQQAELDGFDWFARQQDPYLVRVVQYTTILQAFRACGLTAESTPNKESVNDFPVMQSYRTLIESLLKNITSLNDYQLEKLAAKVANSDHVKQIFELEAASYMEGLSHEELERFIQEAATYSRPFFASDLREIQGLAKGAESDWSERLVNANYLSDKEMQEISEFVKAGLPVSERYQLMAQLLSLEEIQALTDLENTFKSLSSTLMINKASMGVQKPSSLTSKGSSGFCQMDGGRGTTVSVTVTVSAPPCPSLTS